MHGGKLVLEIIAMVGFLLVLLLGAAIWRLSSAPLDVAFAREYIEDSLRNPERGTYARLDSLTLHWPDLGGPLLLEIKGAKVFGPGNRLMISVDEASMALSKANLLIGRISPVALIIKHPQLKLIRTKEGKVDVGFGMDTDMSQIEEQSDFLGRILEYIAHPGSEKKSPLATLRSFAIEDARVQLDDRKLGVSWLVPRASIAMNSVSAGLSAKLYAEFAGNPKKMPVLYAEILMPWDTKNTQVNATLENFDIRSTLAGKIADLPLLVKQNAVLNGKLEAVLDENMEPIAAQINLTSGEGYFMHPGFSAEAVPFYNLAFKATYDGGENKLDILDSHITVKDVTLNVSANLKVQNDIVSGPVALTIDKLDEAQIGPLWPVALKGDNAEEWLVTKLTEGTLTDVYTHMNFACSPTGGAWMFNVRDIEAGFDFSDVSVDYRAPLLPVTKAKGRGMFNYDQEKLLISVDSGMLGGLTVKEAELEFVHIIEKGKGIADVHVKAEGPLAEGFKYLEKEPINLRHKFDVSKIRGDAETTVNIIFPTVPDLRVADVKVNAKGSMKDVLLPDVVKDLDLAGGPLDFTVGGNEFHLAGGAQIEGRAAILDYREFLDSEGRDYKTKITVNMNVDAGLRERMGIDLTDFMEGSAPVDIVYTELPGGKAEANIDVDLKPAYLFFKPLGYDKAPDTPAAAVLKARLENGILKKIENLEVKGPALKVGKTDIAFAERKTGTTLAQASVSHFAAGRNSGRVELTVDAAGLYKINYNGPFLDLRPAMKNDRPGAPYTEPPMDMTLNADTLQLADGGVLEKARLHADIDGQGHYREMTLGALAGKSSLGINYSPDASGKGALRVTADNAGATLRAFGIYNNLIGGQLAVNGNPLPDKPDRNLEGTGHITNFRVVNAPTLASLLSALSLPGILSLLNNEGLTFSKLEADFDWVYRPQGGLLVVKDGRTSGNAVGFTFEGTFDKTAEEIDISGTIIPLSEVNKIIGKIPLIGDILTGGTGSIFAATYTIRGNAQKPDTMVNPLAVLTPGILRRILFEN